MSYYARLIHTAAVYRSTVAMGTTGIRKATYAEVDGMSEVRCYLMEAPPRRMMEMFGPDLDATAIVFFLADADIRPGVSQADGQADKLVITTEQSQVSTWAVRGVVDNGSARKMRVAAVQRVVPIGS